MSDDAKIYTILCTAMVIAGAVAWYCRNDEALQWKQKYEEQQKVSKDKLAHADVKVHACFEQLKRKSR